MQAVWICDRIKGKEYAVRQGWHVQILDELWLGNLNAFARTLAAVDFIALSRSIATL